MATQRPLLPLLVVLYQTALEHPLGAQAQAFEKALSKDMAGEGQTAVPRATQIVAMRQAVMLGILRAEGEKRGRRYFPGTENPGQWSDDELAGRLQALAEADGGDAAQEPNGQTKARKSRQAQSGPQVHATPKATSGQTKRKKAESGPVVPLPLHVQQFRQLQSVVWGIADTLRDKSNLQVDGFRPVTLVLLALKRNLDTQASLQQAGGRVQALMEKHGALLDSGLMTGADLAAQINQDTQIFDPAIFTAQHKHHNKAAVPFMRWEDLQAFEDTGKERRAVPITFNLAANPEGKSWFTYTTDAGSLKRLMEELVELHVADLREAFGAIGLHAALSPADANAPQLSASVLRELVAKLAEVNFSIDAIPGDVFSDVYMDLLGRFAESSGKKGGDFFTPVPLVKGSIRFLPVDEMARDLAANPDKQIKVADPTAGAFTFLTHFYDAIQASAAKQGLPPIDKRQFIFHAQELTPIQAGLGVFNFFFHGLANRLAPVGPIEEANGRSLSTGGAVARIVGNTISEYVPKLGQQAGEIDVCLANPPYGTADFGLEYAKSPAKGDQRWHVGVPTRSEGEWAFMNTIEDLLANGRGKSVVVLPLGVLFRDGGKVFRQYAIEKNWIEGVVALPANQFLTTQIPVCLVLLNKDTERDFFGNPRKHGVFFINATNDFTKTGKLNHWDQDASVEAWETRLEKPGYSGFVPVETLRHERNDYKLSVNRFFATIKEKVNLDPVALAQDVARVRSRVERRGAWLDGQGQEPGLWAQAVAASAVAANELGLGDSEGGENTAGDAA